LVPSKTARNLGVIIDDQLTFTAHIASVSRSCCFALYNVRKIRPYLTQYATQRLVQTLVNSRLDYCNALLTGLPACMMKPLQMIQNAAARLVVNQTKRGHVTPLLIALHWVPVAACIKFKSLMLAYRVIAGSAPTYLNALVRANVTPGCCARLVSVVWHCRLCKHGSPDYSHLSLHCVGMSCPALPEQGRLSLPD